jgi:multidrug efflux pump subunit AcrA (membrane-fusion protein)
MLSRFGAAFLVIGLIVAGYIVIDQMGRDRARAAAARPSPAIPVTVATAETKDVPIIVRGIGTVQATSRWS